MSSYMCYNMILCVFMCVMILNMFLFPPYLFLFKFIKVFLSVTGYTLTVTDYKVKIFSFLFLKN